MSSSLAPFLLANMDISMFMLGKCRCLSKNILLFEFFVSGFDFVKVCLFPRYVEFCLRFSVVRRMSSSLTPLLLANMDISIFMLGKSRCLSKNISLFVFFVSGFDFVRISLFS
jgi:hypothetical protein